MTDFRINTSDLLNNPIPAHHTESHEGNIATQCWQWMGEHKEAVGTVVGAAALAAGSVAAWRYMAGRAAQVGETVVVTNVVESRTSATFAAAQRALAKSRGYDDATLSTIANLRARAGAAAPFSSAPPHSFSQTDIDALFTRLRGGTPGSPSQLTGFESMIRNMQAARAGVPPGGEPLTFGGGTEGAATSGRPHSLNDIERILRSTHDQGAFHAGQYDDDLMRDLLGLDIKHGNFLDTLNHMHRSETDPASTFQRLMPGLKFEMPALSVRRRPDQLF